jgi:hypothetical protein
MNRNELDPDPLSLCMCLPIGSQKMEVPADDISDLQRPTSP